MELLVSWKCVGVKFVISCRKKNPNRTNCLKLSKIFNLRNYSFIGKDPCLASIDGISRLSVLRCEICFFSRWWEICNKDISASFWLGKNPQAPKYEQKWKSTQFPVVSGVEEGTGKAPEVVRKEKTFHPAGMQVLNLLYF